MKNKYFIFTAAPLTGIMTRMIAIRKIQLAGAVLSVLGVGLCYLATQLWNVVLLFGIVAGKTYFIPSYR